MRAIAGISPSGFDAVGAIARRYCPFPLLVPVTRVALVDEDEILLGKVRQS